MKFPPAFYSQLIPQAEWQALREIATRGGRVNLFFWCGRAQAQLDSHSVVIDFNCADSQPSAQITEEQFTRMCHYFMSTRSGRTGRFHWEVRSQAEKNAQNRKKQEMRKRIKPLEEYASGFAPFSVEDVLDAERAPAGIHSQGSGQSFSFEEFQRALAKRAKFGE